MLKQSSLNLQTMHRRLMMNKYRLIRRGLYNPFKDETPIDTLKQWIALKNNPIKAS